MNFRILAVLLLCASGAMPAIPAMAETVRISKAECRRLAEYRAAPDVAYKPGVDVRGKKVTPAGGPDSQTYANLAPDVIEFPIALNPLKGGADRFGETSLNVGVIRFDMKSRRATFNGRALSRGDTQKLARKCRGILRQAR
jgi:hypothetical protein